MPDSCTINEFSGVVNAMTVDVEDYFQVSAFESVVNRGDWERLPCRVEHNTDHILELFDGSGVKATFFMLGWVAERYPGLVRRIVDAGHELASHGYSHVRVTQQKPQAFSEDVVKTRKLLEDAAGCEVKGYRAASYSMTLETPRLRGSEAASTDSPSATARPENSIASNPISFALPMNACTRPRRWAGTG